VSIGFASDEYASNYSPPAPPPAHSAVQYRI